MSTIEELEKKIDELTKRVGYLEGQSHHIPFEPPRMRPSADDPYYTWPTVIEQPCLFDIFYKNNPTRKGEPLGLACSCPKCSPRC